MTFYPFGRRSAKGNKKYSHPNACDERTVLSRPHALLRERNPTACIVVLHALFSETGLLTSQEEKNVAKSGKRSIAAGRKNPEAERAADGNAGAGEEQRVEREIHHQMREAEGRNGGPHPADCKDRSDGARTQRCGEELVGIKVVERRLKPVAEGVRPEEQAQEPGRGLSTPASDAAMTTAVTTSTFAGLIVRFRSVIGRMPIMKSV